jgi:probable F420-dependent oxidoreductase
MVLAYMAWDLARFADGRVVLGIGTQVKGHITRRFSGDWESPGPRLREVVESLQAIFDVFQGRTDSLEYEGEFYSFSLMPDFFRPDPIEHPDIPIHLAAFNPYNLSVVGELCDGLALHPLNTPEYTTEVTSRYVRRGADKADRSTDDIWYSAEPIVATGRSPSERERSREAARRRVSFYASSRTFHDVLEFHGFGDIGERLHELSTEGRRSEMPELVTEEMYETFVLDAPTDDLVDATTDRWEGIADSAILPFEYRSAYDLPR